MEEEVKRNTGAGSTVTFLCCTSQQVGDSQAAAATTTTITITTSLLHHKMVQHSVDSSTNRGGWGDSSFTALVTGYIWRPLATSNHFS
ncbi:hypothetical protein E2C01_028789 [Portunus trituberculatus]|uniref:Uncharacterized protein n=1 Tax=Portunus trituberculatus TaxID=210409 RepID=A0A5B7EQ15_PORTR|nr:hypothetical protein [Portunus trituberculatus]